MTSPAIPPGAPVPAAEIDRVEARLRELRQRAGRAPLPAPQQVQLERVVAEVIAFLAPLDKAIARLRETRGLALEEQERLRERVVALDAETALFAAGELRRVGRIRSAVRVYHAFLLRAPRDARFGDRLDGFSHLCEQFGVQPAASMSRAVARDLPPAWWSNKFALGVVEETLRAFELRWDAIPEAGEKKRPG